MSRAAKPPTQPPLQHPSALAQIDAELAESGLSRYQLSPPSWRAPWLGPDVPDSGVPQFYPTVKGQDEDILSDNNVKNGFVGKNVVQTETFSAHQMIYDKLKNGTILDNLATLASLVSERAQELVPAYGPSTFRLPSRVVTSDSRRETWIAELANPAVPISKLAKSVPHGYRNEKLLQMLVDRDVPLSRAIWYIRTNGATEIQSQRGRQAGSAFSVANYVREWTGVVTEFVRKQLAEVTVPGAEAAPGEAGLATKAAGKSVLADNEQRNTWTKKYTYTLRLVEALYDEHLIDHDAFLRWVIGQLDASNPAQLPFMLLMAEEYLAEFAASEPLGARLVAAALARLSQITSASAPSMLSDSVQSLTSLVRSVFISLPDAFVAAPLWSTHAAQLDKLLLSTADLDPALADTVRADLADLAARADAASEGTQDEDSIQQDDLETIEILDGIAFPASIAATHRALFHKRKRRRALKDEMGLLFTWATCAERAGAHRACAVAQLIKAEVQHQAASQAKVDVEATFIGWIDHSPPQPTESVIELLSELIRVGVVSYSVYLQRMIARGETEHHPSRPPSRHLQLLSKVALHEAQGNSVAKRAITLRPQGGSQAELAALMEKAEDELVSLMPKLVDRFTIDFALSRDCNPLLDALAQLAAHGAHLALTRDLIPQAVARLIAHDAPGESSLAVDDHAILAECYLVTKDYAGLLAYLCQLLKAQGSRELVGRVLDVVEGGLDVWTALGGLGTLGEALVAAHAALGAAGGSDRRLVRLVRQLSQGGHLDAAAFAQFEADQSKLSSSLSTTHAANPLPNTGLAELQALAFDQSPAAISQLAVTVWYRYQAFDNWVPVLLDSVVQLLAQVPVATVVAFLKEIADRLPGELDEQVGKWVAGMRARDAVSTFGGPLGPTLVVLVNELVGEGLVSSAGAVRLLLAPIWKGIIGEVTEASSVDLAAGAAATINSAQSQALSTVATIFGQLLGSDKVDEATAADGAAEVSPFDLLARQRTAARQGTLLTHASLPDVGHCLALLVIQQELLLSTGSAECATKAASLLTHLSTLPAFQMLIARDPQALGTAMLGDGFLKEMPVATLYRPRLLAGLLLALKDGTKPAVASLVSSEDWDLFLSGLTMWRLSISKVEVRAALERLELDQTLTEADKAEALHTLSAHFLDRVCSGEGHTYLGEQVVRCYHGRASDELVSVAFARLAEALQEVGPEADVKHRTSALTTLRCTSRLLDTLLDGATAQARVDSLQLLLGALRQRLGKLLEEASASAVDAAELAAKQKETILHVAHSVALALRCSPPAPAAPETAAVLAECIEPCARLAIALARGRRDECALPLLLLDTCAHLLFGLGAAVDGTGIVAELDEGALVSEAVRARVGRLFGGRAGAGGHAWELVAHAPETGGLGPTAKRLNAGPIDLALFDASVVAVCPPVTALTLDARSRSSQGGSPDPNNPGAVVGTPAPGGHASGAPGTFANSNALSADHSRERGLQTNFDWETPSGKGTGMGVAARDHRRTLIAARGVGSKWDPLGKEKKLKEQQDKAKAHAAAAQQAAAASKAATSKAATPVITLEENPLPKVAGSGAAAGMAKGGSGGAGGGKKRKAGETEVVTLDSDGDEAPAKAAAAAPAAKKGKVAAGKGQGRKKPGRG